MLKIIATISNYAVAANMGGNIENTSVYTKTYRRFKADKDENRNIAANGTIEYLHCLIKKG